MALALPPSEQLKEIRNRLGSTTRDVAEFSHRIAQAEDNSEFHISNAWLTQIENSDSVPSIFKLYSLSSIYRIKFSDILLLYGVDLQHLTKHQLSIRRCRKRISPRSRVYDTEKTVSFPVRFDRWFDVDNYELCSRAHGGSLGRSAYRADSTPGSSAQPLRLHRTPRQHAFAIVAARFFLSRSIRMCERFSRLNGAPDSSDLFRGIARRLRLLVVRNAGRPLTAACASTLGTQRAPPQLRHRSRNHRTSHCRGDAPQRSCGDWS